MRFVPKGMRFDVAANSFWLAYPTTSSVVREHLACTDLVPVTSPVFRGAAPRHHVFLNGFRVSTDVFTGDRLELVVVGQHKTRGTRHFVIVDCWSNALRWDPRRGVQLPNARVRTPSVDRDGVLRARYDGGAFACHVRGRVDASRDRRVDRRFGVDPNHVCFWRDHRPGLSLGFSPDDVLGPVHLLRDVNVTCSLFDAPPTLAFVYPRAMRFVVD